MQVSIGKKIRELRHRDSKTQNEMALALGITPQAISRWESGVSYPDIEILPRIADYFDVTIDFLYDRTEDEQERKKRLDHYAETALRASRSRDEEGALKALRDALEEFPNNYDVMYTLAAFLGYYAERYVDSDPKKYRSMLREARRLYERMIAHCPDHKTVDAANRDMFYLLDTLGEHEKAKEYLDNLPDIWSCRQFAMLGGSDDRHEAAIRLASDAQKLLELALSNMIRSKESGFTAEERAEIAGILESLHRLFYGDVTATVSPGFYTTLARGYSGTGDADNTLRCLRRAADMAAEYDAVDYNNGYSFRIDTVPFKGDRWTCAQSNSTGDYRHDLAEALDDSRWDFVRETPDFAEILRIIAKISPVI